MHVRILFRVVQIINSSETQQNRAFLAATIAQKTSRNPLQTDLSGKIVPADHRDVSQVDACSLASSGTQSAVDMTVNNVTTPFWRYSGYCDNFFVCLSL